MVNTGSDWPDFPRLPDLRINPRFSETLRFTSKSPGLAFLKLNMYDRLHILQVHIFCINVAFCIVHLAGSSQPQMFTLDIFAEAIKP